MKGGTIDIYTNNDKINNYLHLRLYLLCNKFYLPAQLLGVILQESTSWTTLDRYHIQYIFNYWLESSKKQIKHSVDYLLDL